MKNWAIIESDEELQSAYSRFDEIRTAKKDDIDYKEKMLLLLPIHFARFRPH